MNFILRNMSVKRTLKFMITLNNGNVNENFSSYYVAVIEEVLSGEKLFICSLVSAIINIPVKSNEIFICESQVIKYSLN